MSELITIKLSTPTSSTPTVTMPGYRDRVATPDLEIICVDCGGTCYPLGWHPEDGEVEEGTVIPYRCKDCLDRWDIVIGNPDDDGGREHYQSWND